ncbi:MAG: domain containing protein, partial [Conexibacter sp.]|nr:domain containing protein [Conexibacter sp.]
MSAHIEVISGVSSRRLPLEGERWTVGRDSANDIAMNDDETASGLHAVVERFPSGWSVTDLGSSNGTWVNGERIW